MEILSSICWQEWTRHGPCFVQTILKLLNFGRDGCGYHPCLLRFRNGTTQVIRKHQRLLRSRDQCCLIPLLWIGTCSALASDGEFLSICISVKDISIFLMKSRNNGHLPFKKKRSSNADPIRLFGADAESDDWYMIIFCLAWHAR
jgi:hypothetical protein